MRDRSWVQRPFRFPECNQKSGQRHDRSDAHRVTSETLGEREVALVRIAIRRSTLTLLPPDPRR